MTVETAETIAELNAAWPLGGDPKSEGDNHLRLIKSVLQNDVLSLDGGGTITGPVVIDGEVPTIQNPAGTMIYRNDDIAANIGIWSISIGTVTGGSMFQVVPRDATGAVIDGGGGVRIIRNVSGITDLELVGNNVSAAVPGPASVITRTRGDGRYVLKTALAELEEVVASLLARLEAVEQQ